MKLRNTKLRNAKFENATPRSLLARGPLAWGALALLLMLAGLAAAPALAAHHANDNDAAVPRGAAAPKIAVWGECDT
ncbi:MAG TPA: hypothetical protein VHX49_07525 [Candidatus Acidoferrales bacterium]|nr:hypothetical protein [Candidatus Acidoferrales bacterium]